MKKLIINVILINSVFSSTDIVTNECAAALTKATKIHAKYMDGNVSITEDYNTYNLALNICK
jgi:hypothetical protein